MKNRFGWAFPDADELMMNEINPAGEYQKSHLEKALEHVTDWSLAVDAGAHAGTWTRLMADCFARVIAVEPSPDTYEALTANMKAFGCANVDLRQVALGAAPGAISLHLDPKQEARKNTGARYVMDGGTIPRETLDSWQLPTLGFLKLDVEGSEPLVLMGARETLERCRPIVLFENKQFWTERYNLAPEAPHSLLIRAGYQRLCQVSADEIWGPA